MRIKLKPRAKQFILRTSLWVLSALLMLSASPASAADSLLTRAILVHTGQAAPDAMAQGTEKLEPNNDLHHAERKAPRLKVINRLSPFVPISIGAIAATTSPNVGTHGPGALIRPAYYRFLFRYKPF